MREYGEIWTAKPKVLVSRTRRHADHNTRIIGGDDAIEQLAALRAQTDGSISVAARRSRRSCSGRGCSTSCCSGPTRRSSASAGRCSTTTTCRSSLDLLEQRSFEQGVTMHRYAIRDVKEASSVLRQIADGVLVHESEFIESNAVVVQGEAGVLLIDAGITGDEMVAIADDLRKLGQPVVAGFSTHPHWDHLLWNAKLGEAPRYGTARCAADIRAFYRTRIGRTTSSRTYRRDRGTPGPAGLITGLPAEATRFLGTVPRVRIIEHQAHAAGHAALLIEERGVLVAGDMLSDVLIPMLDLSAADPIEDYLAALRLLEGVADDVDVLIPVTGPSAELISYARGSTRIGRTCSPCVRASSQ
jgi:glyoxylase-like metal-dependent hydrolase (beta-lactamase superfamily II)